MFILFATTVALAVIVYRVNRVDGNGSNFFSNNNHVSISRYERQMSGNSRCSFERKSMNDDTIKLNLGENRGLCNGDDFTDDTDTGKIIVEKETKLPNKIRKQPKVTIFPQLQKEQMDALCAAVLLKHRMKESTSLSDLDKIVNDAKKEEKEKCKFSDISASTPVLDVYDVLPSPLPIKKRPVLGDNSNESRLQEEIKAKLNAGKIKLRRNVDEIKSKVNEDETKLKVDEDKVKSKINEDEIKSNSNQENIRSELNPGEGKSNVKDTAGHIDEDVVQGEINDSSPTPRVQNELYDFPPLPRPHNEIYDRPSSATSHNEIYDCPPSPRPHHPPSPKSRNVIVSDSDATGYLFPLYNYNEGLIDEPHYTNAKSMTDVNLI